MKEKIEHIIVIIIIFIAFIVCFQSDTNPLIKNTTDIDSSVFIYIAKLMQNGKLPYKDVFDHKGPLLYLINYTGLSFGSNSYIGIWIIENIFMIINLIYMYKISKLFIKNRIVAVIPPIISLLPITMYWQGGNFTEEYALPFIIISLYYMIKCIINSYSMEKKESFIIGICMSFVLLLRPNMIPLWMVYCPIIFFNMIRNKKYKIAKRTVIYFLLGVILIIGICAIILQVKGILKDCINNYIIFNFKYSQKSEMSILEISKMFYKTSGLIGISIILCIIDVLYKIIKKEKNIVLSISSILFSILTFIIVVLPKNYYRHYGIILIPTFLVPILLYINITKNNKYKYIIAYISAICLVIACKKDMLTMKMIYQSQMERPLYYNEEIIKTIEENTEETDKILVIGNQCSIYLQSNRKATSKYIYQLPIIEVDNDIKLEFLHDLEYGNAKLIIHNESKNKEINEVIEKMLCKNQYTELKKIDQYVILERN